MNTKQLFLKSIGLILAAVLIFQYIPYSDLKVEAAQLPAAHRVLVYTDPFKTNYFNNITGLTDFTELPEYITEAAIDSSSSKTQRDNWYTLTKTDMLSPGEIHRRVQDDLWNRYEKSGELNGGELPIHYDTDIPNPQITIDGETVTVSLPDTLSGRADIYRTNNNATGLWEVKPPSYWTKNKQKGILQLARYVFFGVDESGNRNYQFGEAAAPNIISGGSFEFNAYYACSDIMGITIWCEAVTYAVNYSITSDSLIVYNFTRKPPTKTDPTLNPMLAPFFADAVNKLKDLLKGINPGGAGNPDPRPGYAYGYEPAFDSVLETTPSTTPNTTQYVDAAEQMLINRLVEALRDPMVIGIGSTVAVTTVLAALETYSDTKPSEIIAALLNKTLPLDVAMEYMVLPAFSGYGFDDELSLYVYGEDGQPEDDDEADDLTGDIQDESNNYENAGNAAPPRDPLAIDFGATGIDLTTLDNGVNFDLDNNEFAEKTAWIGTEDGFLALDVNGNGMIDNGGELFGDQFIRSNNQRSEFGFEALSDFDEDDDSLITEEDSVWGNLLVWIDQNHNGKSETGELFTLAEKKITAISIDYMESDYRDTETGTYMAETASVTLIDGETSVSEFWFDVDTTKTTQNGTITSGNVPSVMDAIYSDETGETAQIYLDFLLADDIAVRRYYLKQFLYKITGAQNIAPDSKGGNMDARDLHMVEQFMGRTFVGVDGENPNAPAAAILNQICTHIENIYYCILISQTEFNLCRQKMVTDSESNTIDITALTNDISGMIDCGDPSAKQLVYDLGVYLRVFDRRSNTHLFNSYQAFCNTLPLQYAALAAIAGAEAYTYIGADNENIFKGLSSLNYLFGLNESDTLTGCNGNDVIYGGNGDDMLFGGNGNDTYVIEAGHGNDVIRDDEGVNLILFSDNFAEDDFSIAIDAQLGFVMTNMETGDIIAIPDFITNPLAYKFSFGGMDATFTGSGLQDVINGTDVDDYLEAGDGFNVFYGDEGNDTIEGGTNIDFMYGGTGDDTLLGRNGINVIFGERGNDTIYDGDDGSYLSGDGQMSKQLQHTHRKVLQ